MSVSLAPPLVEQPIAKPTLISYPESDGKPMAETDIHRKLLLDTLFRLTERYQHDLKVYVAGNLWVYYQQGNPKASFAPDVFVVFGVPNHERHIYRIWEEGKALDVVIEFTSSSTQKEDVGSKRLRYEQLGVKEYFIFDPLRDYLQPPLKGFRLTGQYYTPMPDATWDEGEWRLSSDVLGLELRTAVSQLRLFDLQTGTYLRTPHEEAQARMAEAQARAAAEAHAQREAQARVVAEAHAQALAAEVERLKAELARRGNT
jgi:Uma2 family endonuclease